jgi:hypothetical protein
LGVRNVEQQFVFTLGVDIVRAYAHKSRI